MGKKVFAERKENVVAGIVGAFLFSLAGGVVWFVLDQVGFIAGISGLIGVVCAMQGYKLFGGKLSKKGVIIAAVIALLVLVLAWYACLAKDYFDAYKGWYESGEADYMPTYFECFGAAIFLLKDPEIVRSYIISLLIGLAFAVVGGFRYVVNAFATAKSEQQKTPAVAEVTPFTGNPDENAVVDTQTGQTEEAAKDEGSSFIEQELADENRLSEQAVKTDDFDVKD